LASRDDIAGDDASCYGYNERFQAICSHSGEDIKILSTVEDAHRWLGLEYHRSPEP
jgi:hypothetical protein